MNNRYEISILCESAEDVSAEVVWLQTCHSVLARPKMRRRKKDQQKKGLVPLQKDSLIEVNIGVADKHIRIMHPREGRDELHSLCSQEQGNLL